MVYHKYVRWPGFTSFPSSRGLKCSTVLLPCYAGAFLYKGWNSGCRRRQGSFSATPSHLRQEHSKILGPWGLQQLFPKTAAARLTFQMSTW